jgi:hypothetical protein
VSARGAAGLLRAAVLLGLWLRVATPRPSPGDGGPRPTLTVVAAGINAGGSGMLSELKANRPPGRTYRIRLVTDDPVGRRLTGLQQLFDRDRDPEDSTTSIEVRSADDPRLKRFVEEMVRERDVTLNIDMDLVGLGATRWDAQTTALARVAREVAEARLRVHPNSFNSIITHSAATVGLSKLTRGRRDSLFQEKVAAAPQTGRLADDVLIVLAVGDLPSTRTGAIGDLDRAGASRNARAWLEGGHTVLRVHREGFDFTPAAILRTIVPWGWQEKSHERANRPGLHDRDLEVLVPITREGVPGEPPPPFYVDTFRVANASVLQVAKVFTGRAGPLSQAPPGDTRHTEVDRLKEVVKSLEPPRGGGIALQAAAELPVDPAEIVAARWESGPGRLVLLRRGGGVWKLPRMHPEIARAAWRSVFGARARDPEFSIGASLVPGADDAAAPGRQAAYYLGPVENTLFGRVLAAADVALGDLAYGSSRQLAQRGLDQLPGYHSLAEMFPGKYAGPGGESRLAGSEDRVVLQSLPSRLVPRTGDELAWARVPEFAVRFGRTTPAERGYAAVFDAHYAGLVQRVPELRDLVECARAVGTFKWLKQNAIPLASDGPLRAAPARYLTPHQVEASAPIPAAELSPRAPLVRYGEDGPVEIQQEHGGAFRVGYRRGHLRSVVRPDGRMLTVHADDLGQPVAVEAGGFGAAVLLHDGRGGFTFVDDVVLLTRGGRLVGYRWRPSSRQGVGTDAWGMVESLARRFIDDAPPLGAR